MRGDLVHDGRAVDDELVERVVVAGDLGDHALQLVQRRVERDDPLVQRRPDAGVRLGAAVDQPCSATRVCSSNAVLERSRCRPGPACRSSGSRRCSGARARCWAPGDRDEAVRDRRERADPDRGGRALVQRDELRRADRDRDQRLPVRGQADRRDGADRDAADLHLVAGDELARVLRRSASGHTSCRPRAARSTPRRRASTSAHAVTARRMIIDAPARQTRIRPPWIGPQHTSGVDTVSTGNRCSVRAVVRKVVVVAVAAMLFGAPPAVAAGRRPRAVTLEWVGDMAMSTRLGLPPGGVASALAPVSADLHHANVTFGNLEGTLSVSGPSKCATLPASVCFAFQAPPSTAFGLRRLGFRLVNQANNHSLDYGYSGRAQTVAALNAAGVAHTGLPGRDHLPARQRSTDRVPRLRAVPVRLEPARASPRPGR